jgi:PAS domain S-box-containing protein
MIEDEHLWSEQSYHIFGFDPTAKITFAKIRERLHPDDVSLVEGMLQDTPPWGTMDFEFRLKMPTGAIKYVHVVGRRTDQLPGQRIFLSCIQDITANKLVEQELRGSEALLAEGQRLSSTGSFSWRLDNDEVLFSEELNRIFEFKQETAVTLEQIAARVHPDDLSLLSENMRTARSGIEDHRYEIRLRMPNGVVKHVYVVGHRTAHIDHHVFIGAVRDITEQKRSEESLRRTATQLLEAGRLSKTGNSTFDLHKNEHLWTDEMYEIFEFPQGAKLTTELVRNRLHPDDRATYQEFMDSPAERADLEFRLLMPDGRVKYVHTVAHVTGRVNGLPIGSASLRDKTQETLFEQTLAKLRSELTHVARVSALGTLTASIAHEVNQPLSGITTNAGTCLRMLAADPPNLAGARETAERTLRDANRAAQVIVRLRALFARKTTATDAVDLNEATREVIALSASELQRSRVQLKAELAEGLPAVFGDRVQLQQVILNLLLNAVDATSQIDDRPRLVMVRTALNEEGNLHVTVQDAGVGFDAGEAERLFEAFHTTKKDGMGIGLSVSRSIVESHGGRLWAERNEGPGATFAFSIPVRSDNGLQPSQR